MQLKTVKIYVMFVDKATVVTKSCDIGVQNADPL